MSGKQGIVDYSLSLSLGRRLSPPSIIAGAPPSEIPIAIGRGLDESASTCRTTDGSISRCGG